MLMINSMFKAHQCFEVYGNSSWTLQGYLQMFIFDRVVILYQEAETTNENIYRRVVRSIRHRTFGCDNRRLNNREPFIKSESLKKPARKAG